MWVEQLWNIYPRKLDEIFEDGPSAKIGSLEIFGHTVLLVELATIKSLICSLHVCSDSGETSTMKTSLWFISTPMIPMIATVSLQIFHLYFSSNYCPPHSMVYMLGGNFTVGLYSQRSPYTGATKVEVDPNLGRHDDFALVGPYLFAQRNDSGQIHLYISYLRQPFNLTKIPTIDPHDVRKNLLI